MIRRKYGRIINVSSMAGKTGEPLTSPYCTTKFGVIGFTQCVALDLGPHNIKGVVVCIRRSFPAPSRDPPTPCHRP